MLEKLITLHNSKPWWKEQAQTGKIYCGMTEKHSAWKQDDQMLDTLTVQYYLIGILDILLFCQKLKIVKNYSERRVHFPTLIK